MAMKYNRVLIFLGAAGALLVMTVLSVGIGFALPNLMPKQYTHYAAAALFFYFGVKLLMESREAPAESGEHSELAEAEEELAALKLGGGNGSGSGGGMEGGKFRGGKEDEEGGRGEEDIENTSSSTPTGGSMQRNGSGSGGGNGSGALLDMGAGAVVSDRETDPSGKFSVTKRGGEVGFMASLQRDWPVLTQAFMITFLAEWGDRSQIATIAMAAAQHPVGGEWGVGFTLIFCPFWQ
jgi:putative Ca2+/H+ antiporter (TMEM165/GDT1 family)